MAQKLFVGGLAFATSRGFAFVEMMTADGAQRAVADLNGRELDGRSLRVEVSRPKLDGYANRRSGGSWR